MLLDNLVVLSTSNTAIPGRDLLIVGHNDIPLLGLSCREGNHIDLFRPVQSLHIDHETGISEIECRWTYSQSVHLPSKSDAISREPKALFSRFLEFMKPVPPSAMNGTLSELLAHVQALAEAAGINIEICAAIDASQATWRHTYLATNPRRDAIDSIIADLLAFYHPTGCRPAFSKANVLVRKPAQWTIRSNRSAVESAHEELNMVEPLFAFYERARHALNLSDESINERIAALMGR